MWNAFSARNDQLDYARELGRTISAMCFEPVIAHGASAPQSAKKQEAAMIWNRSSRTF
ncbi:MAG: hypothetical protein ACLSA6_08185 [Holdemania massiliensis]